MDAVISGTMPFAVQIKHTQEAGFAALDHARMHGVTLGSIRANVHHNTSQAGANAAFLDRPGDAIETIAMG